MKKKEFNLIEFFLFRWAIMIGVVTINMLLIFLLIIGLFKNSKGSLCLYVINLAIYFNYSEYLKKKNYLNLSFAFAGVLSLISIWALNAFYLSITVFIADYCTSPDQYVLTVAEKNHIKNCKNNLKNIYSRFY